MLPVGRQKAGTNSVLRPSGQRVTFESVTFAARRSTGAGTK